MLAAHLDCHVGQAHLQQSAAARVKPGEVVVKVSQARTALVQENIFQRTTAHLSRPRARSVLLEAQIGYHRVGRTAQLAVKVDAAVLDAKET